MPELVSESRLRRILLLACHAPSGGNGQPWSFAWDGKNLEVFFDKARTPRVTDPGLRGSWIQVGIFLECLAIAASTEKLALDTVLNMPHVDGRPFATVRFEATDAPVSPLAATLAERYTDRRPYAGGDLSAPVFDEIRSTVGTGALANVHFAPLVSNDLIDYILDSDMLFHAWPALHRDTWPLQRWTREDATSTRDGVHYEASGLSFPMSRVIKGIGDRPALIRYLHEHGFLRRLLGRRVRRNLQSAAGIGVLTVRSADYDALVPAGRLGMRAWLMLQHAGYSTHVYGPTALFMYYRAVGCISEVPPRLPDVIARGQAILKRDVHYADDEIPLLVWRLGLTPAPLPDNMRTLRRNLDDILQVKGSISDVSTS